MSLIFLVLMLISRHVKGNFPAYRVCKPGPPLDYPTEKNFKNCLIIGDSVSIGYTPYVKKLLSDVCQVQHAPFDSVDGGSLDTKYGLQCMSLFLSTTQGMSTYYDAIVFNFGLHDVQYNPGMFKEEFVSYEDYLNNLYLISSLLRSQSSNIGYVTSTPIPYNNTLNERVKKYNRGMQELFSNTAVLGEDLYQKVIDRCHEEPLFNSCAIMQKQPNVHYTPKGYAYLAHYVSKLFLSLLKRQSQNVVDEPRARVEEDKSLSQKRHELYWKICPRKKFITERELIRNFLDISKELSHFQDYDRSVTYQLNESTACPPGMTCCRNIYSSTGIGCCVISDARSCFDGLHCCPTFMKCMSSCKNQKGVCYCEPRKQSRIRLV